MTATPRKQTRKKKPRHYVDFRKFRLAKNMTQREVAVKLDVALNTVVAWDAGRQPSTEYLPDLAKLFGVTIEELYGLPRPE